MRYSPSPRTGAISLITLIAIPVLLLLAGLVIYVASLRDSKIEVQNAADAAALAAGYALASDDWLTLDTDRAIARLEQARAAAAAVAAVHFSFGEPLRFDPNRDHQPDGDIVFGHLDRPLGRFQPAGAHPREWVGDQINAVRLTLSRSPLKAPLGGRSSSEPVRSRATAMLDWHVIGLAPLRDEACPLVPIALFTDEAETAEFGWRFACQNGRDEWRFDPIAQQFVPGRDGIREVEVVIGTPVWGALTVPAVFLQLGAESAEVTLKQIRAGVNREHLAKWGGELSLGIHNTVSVPGSGECPPSSDPNRSRLDDALRLAARSGPRIWPLCVGVREDDGSFLIGGWAGARIVTVDALEGGGIRLLLQPAVVTHPAIVADPGHTPPPAYWRGNRTVCAVRLAE
ncbi:MAG: pilus assembly protein TadG-related protein [Gemmataceae bacterium]|nr:pilus assembly protein TadG-related protein [Gemmata sp.]MDW8199184.1 pilus assembly protein TadG-related protein [Gemmataceae bacterium]